MHNQNWFEVNAKEACQQGQQMMGGRGMYHHNGGLILMIGIGLLLLVGVVFLIVTYVNRTRSYSKSHVSGDSAFDILDKEFASGNISEEEYLKKKELLKK